RFAELIEAGGLRGLFREPDVGADEIPQLPTQVAPQEDSGYRRHGLREGLGHYQQCHVARDAEAHHGQQARRGDHGPYLRVRSVERWTDSQGQSDGAFVISVQLGTITEAREAIARSAPLCAEAA